MKSINLRDIYILVEIMFIIVLYFKNLNQKFILSIQTASNINLQWQISGILEEDR